MYWGLDESDSGGGAAVASLSRCNAHSIPAMRRASHWQLSRQRGRHVERWGHGLGGLQISHEMKISGQSSKDQAGFPLRQGAPAVLLRPFHGLDQAHQTI